MRSLVLFDVDGTLIRGGPARDAFHTAMLDAFGTAGDIDGHDFAGKTDPQIARELLTDAGLSAADIDAGFPRLWERYLHELETRLPERPVRVLDGVVALLDALDTRADVAVGLVTGNIADGARLKLGSAGLGRRFEVGGFGSDHETRNHLPGIAIRRANRRWGVAFARERVVVVGDTPLDVSCGRFAGVRTVAVATGTYDAAALGSTGADAVFDDLGDTEAVLEALDA